MKLHEKIRKLRKDRGWTQAHFGSLLNPEISQQAAQQIESGILVPSFERLEDIARVFSLENRFLVEKECG